MSFIVCLLNVYFLKTLQFDIFLNYKIILLYNIDNKFNNYNGF